MDSIDLLVLEHVGVVGVPVLDIVGIPDLVELVLRPLADGDKLRLRVPLMGWYERGAEAEADRP